MRKFSSLCSITILATSLLFIASSCDNNVPRSEQLEQSLAILENNPQKAKELLSSISTPEKMSEADYMQYQLAYFEAKFRTYDDIRSDSSILKVRSYYKKHGNIRTRLYADYYTAVYYYENKQYDIALEFYLSAGNQVGKVYNKLLEGKINNNIGYIYFIQGVADSAIVHFEKAIDAYRYYPNTEMKQMKNLSSLALSYYKKDDYYSAIKYYEDGLALARKQNNDEQIAVFSHNMGSVYCDLGNIEKSKQYLYKALPITGNKSDSIRLYLNLARVYSQTNQKDSIQYYSELVKTNISEVTYKPTLRLIYASLAEYNIKINNYEEAIRYIKLRNLINEEIITNQNAESLLSANNRFTLLLQEEAILRQRIFIYTVLFITLLGIAVMILYFRHQKRKIKIENKLLSLENEQVLLKNTLLKQQSAILISALSTYQDIFTSHNDIYSNNKKDKEKLTELLYNMRKNANELFVEWSKSHIQEHLCSDNILSSLSDEELRIMHLAFLEYPYQFIANILGFEYEEKDMNNRIYIIRNKLLAAGMEITEINSIFLG